VRNKIRKSKALKPMNSLQIFAFQEIT